MLYCSSLLKRATLGGLLLLSGFGRAQAQSFAQQFRQLMQQPDSQATAALLRRWQRAQPHDPEFYIAKFNYQLNKAQLLELSTQPSRAGEISLLDQAGKAAGSVGSGYRPALVAQAAATLREGIQLAPDRLDMRFGLAKAYELAGEPAAQLAGLREAMADHARRRQPWRWRAGAALPQPEGIFVPDAIEGYISYYWKQDGPGALEDGRALAALLVQYYPKSSLGYFNLGVFYSLSKQPAKAYEQLQLADQRQPRDLFTLHNLTKIAMELKHKAAAAQYLARLQQLLDSQRLAADLTKQLRAMP